MMTLAYGVAAVMQRFARFASTSAAQGGSAAAKLSLLTKGKDVVTAVTKEQLLNRTDHGVYTTARTVDKWSVVEFAAHLTRIANSCKLVLKSPSAKASPPSASYATITTDEELLRPHVVSALRDSFRVVEQRYPHASDDLRVTLLLDWTVDTAAEPGFDLFVHVEEMPPRPTPPVEVKVARRPPMRNVNEVGKDTKWIHDRKQLEQRMGKANEVVMTDDDGFVLEGTQSNIQIIQNGKVLIPFRKDILEGTIQKIVIRVCEENSIPYEKTDKIPLNECNTWEGAFLTSTSRLVLPIERITVIDEYAAAMNIPSELRLPQSVLAERLLNLVRAHLRQSSERIVF